MHERETNRNGLTHPGIPHTDRPGRTTYPDRPEALFTARRQNRHKVDTIMTGENALPQTRVAS